MKNYFYALILFLFLTTPALSQNETQAFGKIDISDLELKECSFEKDANAMVLFDKGNIYFGTNFNIVMERHKRIKIFNAKAKDEANIRLEYYGGNKLEFIAGLQAQTLNLKNGKVEIIKLDKKSIFNEVVDKSRNAIVFSLPNIQDGSVIEFKYRWETVALWNFPNWYFQSKIPVRYSELTTSVPEMFFYKTQTRITYPFVKNTTSTDSRTLGSGVETFSYNIENKTKALANIPSLADEPYMTSRYDNLQSILFQLNMIKPFYGFTQTAADTWPKIGGKLIEDEDFGKQFKKKLDGEEEIIAKANAMKSDEAKIAYLFNEVKNTMKWNEVDRWYTNDGTSKAWNKKTGNSTEINLILYHLLLKAGIKAYPMLVSTRDNGKVYIAYPSLSHFNRTVAYVRLDSTKKYVLDATDKFQSYNEMPSDLLNSYGFWVDKENEKCDVIPLSMSDPAKQLILINAEIKPEGIMHGNATLSSFKYHRYNYLKEYKTEGEEKYKDYLRSNNNNLKISSLKIDNADIDTLPLNQNIAFDLELAGSGDDYIYFSPNLFSSFKSNPFLSESRNTDIDFGYKNNFTLTAAFKLPEGYKIDALPKNATMDMPDKSISFRRIVGEQGGRLLVRYTIDYKKTVYFKEDYPVFREFYQKMFEMLNEPVALKKL